MHRAWIWLSDHSFTDETVLQSSSRRITRVDDQLSLIKIAKNITVICKLVENFSIHLTEFSICIRALIYAIIFYCNDGKELRAFHVLYFNEIFNFLRDIEYLRVRQGTPAVFE